MKKTLKKLALNKETLRSLNDEQVAEAAGGQPSIQYSRCPELSCGIGCTFNTNC
ncbi:MAG TPA: class I lanthipeptide [Thermoanaerobaculia bacterium]|nr:class I lanthipeptide [Thermoanaerobaculia bacterium]